MFTRRCCRRSARRCRPSRRRLAYQLAEQLKADYSGSTYAQFAALHLARVAVAQNDLAEAQAQLRWVLGKADKGSDTAQIAQLRLARVLAASGEPTRLWRFWSRAARALPGVLRCGTR